MWFDNDGALLPGLLPGLYRGITFHVPDTSTAPGRRVAEHLFPGVDLAGYDDMGLCPNEVTIDGIIIGDDYVAQAQALIAAFNTAGPATLVHPWLGPMTVIMLTPGDVSFSDRELRVVRFSATFTQIAPGAASMGFSSLTGLTSAISLCISAASALCLAAGTKIISATRQKAAARSHRIVTAMIADLGSPSGSGRFVPRLKSSLPALSANPAQFDTMMAAIGNSLSEVTVTPAVAPAAEAVIETPADPHALVSVGQAIASGLLAEIPAAPSDTDAGLLASAVGRMIAAIALQAIHTSYESRQAALAYRTTTVDLIDSLIDLLDVVAAGLLAGEASALRRALRALQSAVIVDVNETLGRLPTVQLFEPDRPVDAWQLATHIAGDKPSSIETVYLDIVARNRPRHPAFIDLPRIEVRT